MYRLLRFFFAPRTVWIPTLWGWLLLVGGVSLSAGAWMLWGEQFLAQNERVEPDVLVVEAWIGPGGVEEAARLYQKEGYRWVVATAVNEEAGVGFADHDFAAYTTRVLTEHGVPREKILRLSIPRVPRDRTHTAMAAVAPALAQKGIQPKSLTVFTIGPHTRRSRMTLAELNPGVPVGSVAWFRVDGDKAHWWQSTERTKDFLNESLLFPLAWLRLWRE